MPPVRISPNVKTLEFDHIALIASGDHGLVEYSLDNGVHFLTQRSFDRTTHQPLWTNDVHTSTPASEGIDFSSHNGSDLIARFRLFTGNTIDDGWYITNIRFTDKLSVPNEDDPSADLSVISQPVLTGHYAKLLIDIPKHYEISIAISDVLGNAVKELLSQRPMEAGRYQFGFLPPKAGLYVITLTGTSAQGTIRRSVKLLVID